MEKIRVLSLFDGIAGARQALKELNIDCEYFAIEIDRFAYHIAKANHQDIYHLSHGYICDIKDFLCDEWEKQLKDIQEISNHTRNKQWFVEKSVDLLIGGSPCQDLSIAKRGGKGLDGEKSGLFYEYLRILKKVKPKYFVLENVASMKKEAKNTITQALFGIEPILIDSALVTAQQRKRLYWVGKLQKDGVYKKVEINQPENKEILLKDIIESGDTERLKSYCITATYSRACPEDYFNHGQRQLIFKERDKSACLPATYYKENLKSLVKRNKQGLMIRGCAMQGRNIVDGKRRDVLGAKTEQGIEIRNDDNINCLTTVSKDSLVLVKDLVRKLTPVECERLQGFPDGYSEGVSNSQRYKALGNSFTVPVIKHILQQIL